MNTVKSMAISPQMINHWDKQLASYVTAGLKVTKIATIGQQRCTTNPEISDGD